jgi:hypothetical protein
MARKDIFEEVFGTDTFDQWRLKTNSIRLNLQDMYDEIDNFPNIAVMLKGNQTVDGIKTFIKPSVWDQEYTKGKVTPLLELKIRNSDAAETNDGHQGSGPAIDFYNPDTTATGNTWLSGRIASICDNIDDRVPDGSLVFYTAKNTKDLIEQMRITSSGKVGIGTSTPQSILNVYQTGNDAEISIQSRDDKSASITFGDSKSHKSGAIKYFNIGNSMRFFTGEASTGSSAERMRITSSGNVGIKTGNPEATLDVHGNIISESSIEAGPQTGGVALTVNDGYGNANVAFNHNRGIPSNDGSSARIECGVDVSSAAMIFELGDNSQKNIAKSLTAIIQLKTDRIDLYKNTYNHGNLSVSGKIGIKEESPDWDLNIGGKTTEAGHVALNANGGEISLRPKANTTHGWRINAYDKNAGQLAIVSSKWNTEKSTYDNTAVTEFRSDNSVYINRKLNIGSPGTSNNGTPSSATLTVKTSNDNSVSAQFRGGIQVNQWDGNTRAYGFLSTNHGSTLIGGNLRYSGNTNYSKGTNFRASAAIALNNESWVSGTSSSTDSRGGQIQFLRANDTNDSNYTVSESGRFDEYGNLGLGTTNPITKLDVNGSIRSNAHVQIHSDGWPQLILANANGKDERFGIWRSGQSDAMYIGPQNTAGSGTSAIRINRNASIEVPNGGKLQKVLNDDNALVNKKYVDDAVDGFADDLSTLKLKRVNASGEGGQITFNRSSDDTGYWHIDTYGTNSAKPNLRVFHENDSLSYATQTFTITSDDNVGINETDPDWMLCVGNKQSEAGHIAAHPDGGMISIRPTANKTHRWLLNAHDADGGSLDIAIGALSGTNYTNLPVATFTKDRDVNFKHDISVVGTINAGGNIHSKHDHTIGDGKKKWILHTRQGNDGDFFELAARKDDNSNWDWGKGFRQKRDGSVGIGKTPGSLYKLDVNGGIRTGKITSSTIVSSGPDIMLDNATRRGGQTGGYRRALVHGTSDTLVINYAGDYTGGVIIKGGITAPDQTSKLNALGDTALVTKKYVDNAVSSGVSSIKPADNFEVSDNIAYSIGTKNTTTTASGNVIPNGDGKYSHGTHFVGRMTSTNSSDGGGLFIEVTDTNDDEHAISVYNSKKDGGKEVFHVRSTDGDTFVGSSLYANENIGLNGHLSFNKNSSTHWKIEEASNSLYIRRKNSGQTKTALSFGSDNKVTLGTEGTADNHLITKKYVDDNFVGSSGPTISGVANFSGTIAIHGSSNPAGERNNCTYASNGTNLLLKGSSEGVSGLFFQSEKDGTNINHASDFGFIQYHARGVRNTTGEKSDLVIGVTNDGPGIHEDQIIFDIPNKNNLKVTYDGGVTEYKVWHEGNDGSGSGLDADKLDGIDSADFFNKKSTSNQTIKGDVSFDQGKQIRFGHTSQTDGNDGSISAGKFASGLNIVGVQTKAGEGRVIRTWGKLITSGSHQYWHSGNDGSGSGLDADTLDGYNASDFALKGEGGTTIDGLSAAQFLRSDVDDEYTGSTLTIKGGKIRVRDDASPSLYFDLYTEENTTKLADEFGGNTDKKFIRFSTGTGSGNDSGFIAHETNAPSTNAEADKNRGVLHLCPSDDNAYGDYVSIHGTNDSDKLQLHTDGTIRNLGAYLRLCGGTDTYKTDVRIGTSSTGYKVWHEGNDGAGSGLDADKLAGVASTSYAKINTNISVLTPTEDAHAATKKYVDDKFINDSALEIIKKMYPIGSIYTNTTSIDPATEFGFGTWQRFGAGKVLVGVNESDSDFDAANKTGGKKMHTLTIDEIPSHTHTLSGNNRGSNSSYGQLSAPGLWYDDAEREAQDPDTISSTGGGQSHENMPPYITVYMWTRTN